MTQGTIVLSIVLLLCSLSGMTIGSPIFKLASGSSQCNGDDLLVNALRETMPGTNYLQKLQDPQARQMFQDASKYLQALVQFSEASNELTGVSTAAANDLQQVVPAAYAYIQCRFLKNTPSCSAQTISAGLTQITGLPYDTPELRPTSVAQIISATDSKTGTILNQFQNPEAKQFYQSFIGYEEAIIESGVEYSSLNAGAKQQLQQFTPATLSFLVCAFPNE